MKPVVVLGATGSIGRQALEVAHDLAIDVDAVASHRHSSRLDEIAAAHPDADIVIASEPDDPARAFAAAVPNSVTFGPRALEEVAARPGRTVLNGIVGAAGLGATLAALEAGNRLALANKESLVAAGELVMAARRRGGGELIPVDSEHSALLQCLDGEHPDDVARLVLTASGGPFRGRKRDQLAAVGVEQALAHPTWEMGGRITIDSATLMNKGLEVIEAHHLFGIPFERIDVVVHPQSIVHSAVEFVDGALKAHVGHPDMRIPIQYALTYPRRGANPGPAFSLAGRTLEFLEVDRDTFPALDLAYSAGKAGGTAPAVLNAADEVAVEAFLDGRIGFLGITEVVTRTLEQLPVTPVSSVEDVVAADREARAVATELISSAKSTA